MLYGIPEYLQDIQAVAACGVALEALRNCNILITGASGLIGSLLTDTLAYANDELGIPVLVYALGRSARALAARFASHKGRPYFHIVEQDISRGLPLAVPMDYIIHAASNAYPAAFAADPVGTMLANIMGTHAVLEHARTYGCRQVLYVSSGEVYGQGAEGIRAFDEAYSGYVDPVNPRSCYPNSKRAAETLCASYARQYGIHTVIARPCHIYGPTATRSDNRVSAQFINDVLAGRDITMKSAGTQLRSYCYVADCVSALLYILLRGQTAQAYNVANRHSEVTIAQMAQIIARLGHRQVRFDTPADAQSAGFSSITQAVLNPAKLEGLGWQPAYDMPGGVQRTLRILTALQRSGG